MWKRKVLRLFGESKGFTMMEMIITVAITAIFFGGVVTVLPTIMKSHNKIISLNYARQIASSVSDSVSEQLSYAGNVVVEDKEGKRVIRYIYKGELREMELGTNGVVPGLVYDEDYYMGREVTLAATIDSSENKEYCIFTMEISNEGESTPVLKKEYVIRLYG